MRSDFKKNRPGKFYKYDPRQNDAAGQIWICLSLVLQGRSARKGHLVTRITVTLSIFIFSTRFFAQIVENRETQLSSLFLGPGDNFSKSYDENKKMFT